MLGVSQPALSIQVRALEDAYEVKLFHRHGRTVRLTTAGKELLELSRRFMSLEGQIAETLSASKGLGRGRLKLAFDGPHITMPLLSRFHGLHPEIEVSVSMGNSRFVRQQLIERHVDLAVLPGVGEDSKIHAIAIKHHAPVVIVGPGTGGAIASSSTFMRSPASRWSRERRLEHAEAGRRGSEGARPDAADRPSPRQPGSGDGGGRRWSRNQHRMGDGGAGLDPSRSIPLTGSTIKSIDSLACMKDEVGRRMIKAFFSVLKEVAHPAPTRQPSARASGELRVDAAINEARCLGSGLRRLEPVTDREPSAPLARQRGHRARPTSAPSMPSPREPRVRLDAVIGS